MELAPTYRTLCATPFKSKRPCRDQLGQAGNCPDQSFGTAFLRQSHQPLFRSRDSAIKDYRRIECRFYHSLENLCRLYGFKKPQKSTAIFPMNIVADFGRIKAELTLVDDSLELILNRDEDSKVSLATVKTFGTGNTLFYLPVAPLYGLLTGEGNKALAELLLSVMAYLYQITGIPHFREDYVYLESIYAMIEEYTADGGYWEDKDEEKYILDHFEMIHVKGDYTLKRMSDKKAADCLGRRTERFKGRNGTDKELLACAKKLAALHIDYPYRSVMDGMQTPNEADDGYIRAEQYLCFYWSSVDCLQDQLLESVNAELNEYGAIEEPVSIQYFDRVQERHLHDMDYERRLFEILHELSDVLYDLEHGKLNGKDQ